MYSGKSRPEFASELKNADRAPLSFEAGYFLDAPSSAWPPSHY